VLRYLGTSGACRKPTRARHTPARQAAAERNPSPTDGRAGTAAALTAHRPRNPAPITNLSVNHYPTRVLNSYVRSCLRQGCAEPGNCLWVAAKALVLSGLEGQVAVGVEAKDSDVMNNHAPERILVVDRPDVCRVPA
jgi:hypothetical protein